MADADIQTSLAGGELSPQLYARVDLDKFQVGAALIRNFFVDYRGGVSNRPGTEFIDQASGGARLLPFIVSTAASYVLVLTAFSIAVYNRGVLVDTVATPYKLADLFDIQFTQSADVMTLVHPAYPPADLTRTSDTGFSYAPISTGPGIQPPTITAMRAPHSQDYMYGYVVTAVDADGKEESLPSNIGVRLSLVQNEGSNQVIGLNWTAPAQSVSHYNIYKWGPNDLATMVASTTWGFIGTAKATSFTDNNIAPDFSKQPPDYGDPFSGGQFASITVVNPGAGYTTTGQFPNIPFVPLTITGDGTGAAGYAVLDNSTHTIVGVFLTSPGKGYTNAVVTANGQGGAGATFAFTFTDPEPLYPAATAYLQQRRVFGGSYLKPETLVMSQPGIINNFNTTPVALATDAIVASIAAEEVNTIQSLVQVNYGLIAFTTGGSFLVNGGQPGAAIDSRSPSIQPQVSQGANNLRPLRINYDVIYGQHKGNRIHNLAFAWQKQSYTGGDISTLAAHLFDTHLTVDWAYAEEPYKIVWAVRDDGKLLSLTYVPDQEVLAWARHDTQGLFKSICSVPEDNEDAIYTIVERYVPGVNDPGGDWVYYLERFASRQGCCIYDAWFLDCALSLATPTSDNLLYVTPAGPDTVQVQTYPPGTVSSGIFGGQATFSAITGLMAFDTSLGGDGNGVAIPDFDRNVFFTSSSATSACAVWDLTATNTPPARLHYHATHGGQAFQCGAVDSQGYFYLLGLSGFGFSLNKISPDLQTQVLTNFPSPSVTQPSNVVPVVIGNSEFLVTCGGQQVSVVQVRGPGLAAPIFAGNFTGITDPSCQRVARSTEQGHVWCLTGQGQFAGSYTRQGQPFHVWDISITPGAGAPVTGVIAQVLTPQMFGWTHWSGGGMDIIGDETDNNVIIFSSTVHLSNNYNPATGYNQYDLVVDPATNHDYESVVGGNTGHAPAIGGTPFWRDLGVHQVVDEYRMLKLNTVTGAVMWNINLPGGQLNGYREFSRIRYGGFRMVEPSASGGFHNVHDVNTLTGADNVGLLWNVAVSAGSQFYNDRTGQWIAGVGYGYLAGQPHSPMPIGATPGVWNGWAELGPAAGMVFPPAFPSAVGKVIQIDCGKIRLDAQTDAGTGTGTIIAPLEMEITDDPNGLFAPVEPNKWTITQPAQVVHGLDHLEGKEVWALADGTVVGPLIVVGGSVDVGFLATNIVVGLKYTQQVKTLYLTTQGLQSGSDQGKRKLISGVTLRVDCSRGLQVGTEFGDYLTPIPELQENDLYTGDARALTFADWNTRGEVCIQQDQPLPATVLGIIVEVTPGDTGS